MHATVGAAASAVRHGRWWLEWHTRARPGEGSRALGDEALLGRSMDLDESAA